MLFSKLFNRHKQEHTEESRRARLRQRGRIADGIVIDTDADEHGATAAIYYAYNLSGVDYESSQTLDADQRQHIAHYIPGAHVTIRYDPRQPANSVVV